jgi:hypothetical protein
VIVHLNRQTQPFHFNVSFLRMALVAIRCFVLPSLVHSLLLCVLFFHYFTLRLRRTLENIFGNKIKYPNIKILANFIPLLTACTSKVINVKESVIKKTYKYQLFYLISVVFVSGIVYRAKRTLHLFSSFERNKKQSR